MPTELRALCRLLGMVSPADQPVVLDAIRGKDLKELGDLLLGHVPGGDPALGRGLCLAAARLNRTGALPKVRQLLGDPHPGVRAAAAEAVGAVGGASAVPALTGQLAEADPAALAAVITALAGLALRINRPDLARDPLGRLRGSLPDPAAAALGEARQRLG
jgi:HEAT repeat protein